MQFYSLQTVTAVQQLIRQEFSALPAETIDITLACGRVCAASVQASENVPAFPRSTVDGYAVKAQDTYGASESIPAFLQKQDEVAMGQPAPNLLPGSAIYVPTGGMLPPGADAVIMIEDVELLEDLLNCYRQVAPGDNVIQRGEDIALGKEIIPGGRLLRAQEIGLLASLGIGQITVTRQPRVGILSSGDEIVPRQTLHLTPGQVRDSNGPALLALAAQHGAITLYGGIVPDEYSSLQEKGYAMLNEVDFLVLSGGSSVGARDHTARFLEELRPAGLLVHGVAMQPGKPTLLTSYQGKPVLGLPGHPVAALNVFSLFGLPILQRLLGQEEQPWQSYVDAYLTHNIASKPGRADYIRVRLQTDETGKLWATPIFGRSGLLSTLSDANGILVVEAGLEGILAGEIVRIIPLP